MWREGNGKLMLPLWSLFKKFTHASWAVKWGIWHVLNTSDNVYRWWARLEAGNVQWWGSRRAGSNLHDKRRLWRVCRRLPTTSVGIVACHCRAWCIVMQLWWHFCIRDRQRSWQLVSTTHHQPATCAKRSPLTTTFSFTILPSRVDCYLYITYKYSFFPRTISNWKNWHSVFALNHLLSLFILPSFLG